MFAFLLDMFPLIADALDRTAVRKGQMVPHDEIVTELLTIPEAAARLESRAAATGKPLRWTADNTVAWFSQWITTGKAPDYERRFARERRQGRWAYLPICGRHRSG